MSDTHIAVNASGIVVKGEKAFLVLLSSSIKGLKVHLYGYILPSTRVGNFTLLQYIDLLLQLLITN